MEGAASAWPRFLRPRNCCRHPENAAFTSRSVNNRWAAGGNSVGHSQLWVDIAALLKKTLTSVFWTLSLRLSRGVCGCESQHPTKKHSPKTRRRSSDRSGTEHRDNRKEVVTSARSRGRQRTHEFAKANKWKPADQPLPAVTKRKVARSPYWRPAGRQDSTGRTSVDFHAGYDTSPGLFGAESIRQRMDRRSKARADRRLGSRRGS